MTSAHSMTPSFALLLLILISSTPARAQDALPEWRIDPQTSQIYVVTHRAGLLSFLGHEHAILAPAWSATFCWDGDSPANAYASLTIDTPRLVIDSDRARDLAELGHGPSAEQRETLQHKMLDDQHLAAATYPEIQFTSRSMEMEDARTLLVHGRLTIRDVTNDVKVPLTIERDKADPLRISGTLSVKQSAFGIEPESVAGVVKVKDAVDIHVLLDATATDRSCPIHNSDSP